MTDTNWQRLYAAMYLKIPKEVTKAARPSRMTVGTHEMFATFEVNGEATDDSASDKDIPVWAALSAPQSFAPSPHIAAPKINRRLNSGFNVLVQMF